MWTFSTDAQTGITVRDVDISTFKGGDPITVIQLTDVHLNYCNGADLQNPTLKSTWENRKWLKIQQEDGEYKSKALKNLKSCLDFVDSSLPSQLVVTGDILDYLSEGGFDLADQSLFTPYPTSLACLGNHEAYQKMQGEVEETLTFEQRMDILRTRWHCDISYVSRVLADKVMLIVMDNASAGGFGAFTAEQTEKLERDIATARKNDYTVLLFYHIPLATENPQYKEAHAEPYVQGDRGTAVWNFETRGIHGDSSDPSTRRAYELITSSADVIKATFCGHKHNDYYTEINATDINGVKTAIPQYILIGTPYGTGNALRITVN